MQRRCQCSDVPVPGVLTLAVLFTAVFSAGSIVWDREFGFLREMLVAPLGAGQSLSESA